MKLRRLTGFALALIMSLSSINISFAESTAAEDLSESSAEFAAAEYEDTEEASTESAYTFETTDSETETVTEIADKSENITEAETADYSENTTETETQTSAAANTTLENPVMTPENAAKLNAYKAKLRAEIEEEGIADSELLAPLSADDLTFEQYLADYNYNFNGYDYYKTDFTLPYRSFVETKKNDPTYQVLLGAWRVATFELSDITDYSYKEAGFYETILYDVLYQGNDVESISGNLNDIVDTVQASSLKKIAKFFDEEGMKIFTDWDSFSSLSIDQVEQLDEACSSCEELEEVFGAIGDISKVLGYVDNVEELIYKLAKAQAIASYSDDTAKILLTMESYTSNPSLQFALDNLILACSDCLSEEYIIMLFSSEMVIGELLTYALDETWKAVLKHLSIYGYAVSAGQAAGKLVSGWLFSTDEDVEMYYNICALYEFEDALKQAMTDYENNYLSSQSHSASKTFNECYKLLLKTYLLGAKSSKEYVEIEYTHGLVNSILLNFREDKYNDYITKIDNITRCVENTIEFMDTIAYNGYLEEYCIDTAEQLNLTQKEETYTEEQKTEVIEELEQLAFETGNTYITDDMTLTSDKHTYGSVYMSGGTVDLNGYSFTIDGDLVQTDGVMYINNGSLTVNGDYRIQTRYVDDFDGATKYDGSNGYLKMIKANDYVEVDGDFYVYSYNHSGETLSNGTMILKGDFTQQTTYYSDNFYTTGNHKVILSGTGTQNISFDNEYSQFNELSYNGSSSIIISDYFQTNKITSDISITSNDANISLIGDLCGKTLSVTGNIEMSGDIDLDSGKITVNGELLQTGGEMYINNGSLTVNGDYRIQTRYVDDFDGITKYAGSYGYLKMIKANDYVEVDGDFYVYSYDYSGETLSNGTMVLKGDFTQQTTYSSWNFDTTGNHKVILSGTSTQNISFDNECSQFNELSYNGSSSIIISDYFQTNKITSDMSMTSNDANISLIGDLCGKTLSVTGNIEMSGDIDLDSGKIILNGELMQTAGTLYINNGSLTVNGDYRIQTRYVDDFDGVTKYDCSYGYLKMIKANDYVEVGGDFYMQTYSYSPELLTNGTMVLKGNFTQQTSYAGSNFDAAGDHKVILSGTGTQNISFDNEYSQFNELSYNGSSNIIISNYFQTNKITSDMSMTSNDANISLIGDLCGKTLSVTGNIEMSGDIDLDSGKIILNGELMQTAGTMYINNGSLTVNGDYRIQTRYVDDFDGATKYDCSYGYLKMIKANDYVEVGGDFYMQTYYYSPELLTNGTMVLKGDFTQQTAYTGSNFDAAGNHKVILNGTGTQNISFDNTYSQFNILQIANTAGKINFTAETIVADSLTQPGGADIINRDNVYLQGESAFVDYGELNTAINTYVGNAVNVIPTWMDYAAYISAKETESTESTTETTTETTTSSSGTAVYDTDSGSISVDTATGYVRGIDTELAEIVIPSAVEVSGSQVTVTGITAGTFDGCTGLTSIVIPSTVEYIEDGAFSALPDITIIAEEYSYAYSYAAANGLKYSKLMLYILGDADGDGSLTAADAASVLQKVLDNDFKITIEENVVSILTYTNVDGDAALTAGDAACILQKVLDSDYSFPAAN